MTPSAQILRLIERFPENMREDIIELAQIARELAAEHGRSRYGDPARRLTPNDVYREDDAIEP